MNSSNDRTSSYRRNEALEELLAELSVDLGPSERGLIEKYSDVPWRNPVILVMAPLRSGTTLFMQWLAATGLFAYPTNLLSRFHAAPILGAKIQLLLTDPRYRFRDELHDITAPADFLSDNGKTRGALAPNEFWYFWRRFLPDPSRDVWTDDELRQGLDATTMRAELAGLLHVFGKPFAAKGMLFNYNIRFLDTVLDNVVFVQLRRDPVANVASVLEARERQFGDQSQWYSFRIPEFQSLEAEDPVSQAAGQVTSISRAIDGGLATVAENRKIVLSYEHFCERPNQAFDELAAKVGLDGARYCGPARFDKTRSSIPDAARIEKALQRYL